MNKQKKAVAIKYVPLMSAPKVIAKGSGRIAEKMIENKRNIPVYENKDLIEELAKVEIGDSIPPELYEVVAKILLFISDLDKLESYRRNAKQ